MRRSRIALTVVVLALLPAFSAIAADTGSARWAATDYFTLSGATGAQLGIHLKDFVPVPMGAHASYFHEVTDGVAFGLFAAYAAHVGLHSAAMSLHELFVGGCLRLGPERSGTWFGFQMEAGASVLRKLVVDDGARWSVDPNSFYMTAGLAIQSPGVVLSNGVRLGVDASLGLDLVAGGSMERHESDMGQGMGIGAFGLFLRLGLLIGMP